MKMIKKRGCLCYRCVGKKLTLEPSIVEVFTDQLWKMMLTLNILGILVIIMKLGDWWLIPLWIIGSWIAGTLLDKIGYPHGLTTASNKRNPEIQEILTRLDGIENNVLTVWSSLDSCKRQRKICKN